MPPRLENTPEHSVGSSSDEPNAEFLREGLRLLVQLFIELEISAIIDAAPHERSASRRSYRNGYRRRTWMTSLGELMLEIPKLRKGTYYPAFLETLRQRESILINALRQIRQRGVSSADVEMIITVMNFPEAQQDQIAEFVEQIYDLLDRFRDKPRFRNPENLALFRPINAIATRMVEATVSDSLDRPKALYMGSLAMGQVDDWLTESLDVLIRLHQAFTDEAEAVAT